MAGDGASKRLISFTTDFNLAERVIMRIHDETAQAANGPYTTAAAIHVLDNRTNPTIMLTRPVATPTPGASRAAARSAFTAESLHASHTATSIKRSETLIGSESISAVGTSRAGSVGRSPLASSMRQR